VGFKKNGENGSFEVFGVRIVLLYASLREKGLGVENLAVRIGGSA
jgi:hypothetical protein